MIWRAFVVWVVMAAMPLLSATRGRPATSATNESSCFLLFEEGVGEVRRDPADACRTRVTPASTFKVPHALAALDAGVIQDPAEVIAWDGRGDWPESSRRDHTLATAMRHSVVWYFQNLAVRLGADREREYLRRFRFGNMDASSGLTTFWLGGSLLVSPEEQLDFWRRLYSGQLPVAPRATAQVREILVQPPGVIVNAAGAQPFGGPWPAGVVVSAKPGSIGFGDGRAVRWLVGRVERRGRAYFFVSCVIGSRDLAANAAIDLAARSLRTASVL